jgi:hypothetical protein
MFWLSLLIASQVVTTSSAAATSNGITPSSLAQASSNDFLLHIAKGVRALANSQPSKAKLAFEKATRLQANSAIAHHYLAISLAQVNEPHLALKALETSFGLGNRSHEADELKALLLVTLGRVAEARQVAARLNTLPGALIGVTLDDPEALVSISTYVGEPTYRGLLASAVLSASAAKTGMRVQARRLGAIAQEFGNKLSRSRWSNAVFDLMSRIQKKHGGIKATGRLKTSFDYVKNPQFQAAGQSTVRSGLRLSSVAEAVLAVSFDSFEINTAIFALNRIYLAERDLLQDYALNGLAWATEISVPLNNRPKGTRLNLSLRIKDLYAKTFALHYANSIEGGPALLLPLGPRTRIQMGILGVATDFIDRSPPDDVVSSQNRDSVGQRAFIEIDWYKEGFRGDVAGFFVRDDARGEAFDMNGLGLSGRIHADLTGGLFLRIGAGVAVGRFGPVGEAAVLGAAAIRSEVRLYGDIGVIVQLSPWLQLSLENNYLQNAGRSGHAYTDNILSVGLEAQY